LLKLDKEDVDAREAGSRRVRRRGISARGMTLEALLERML